MFRALKRVRHRPRPAGAPPVPRMSVRMPCPAPPRHTSERLPNYAGRVLCGSPDGFPAPRTPTGAAAKPPATRTRRVPGPGHADPTSKQSLHAHDAQRTRRRLRGPKLPHKRTMSGAASACIRYAAAATDGRGAHRTQPRGAPAAGTAMTRANVARAGPRRHERARWRRRRSEARRRGV